MGAPRRGFLLVFAGFWDRKAIIWQTVQAHVFWHRDDDVTWLAQCDFVVSRGFQAAIQLSHYLPLRDIKFLLISVEWLIVDASVGDTIE